MRRLREYFLMLCVVCMVVNFSGTVLLSQTSCTVSGKVIDEETGKGVKDVEIFVTHDRISHSSAITSDNGDFSVEKIAPGEIRIMFLPPTPYVKPYFGTRYEKFFLERGKNLYIMKKLKYGGVITGKIYEVQSGLNLKEDEIENIFGPVQLPPFYSFDKNGNYRVEQIIPGFWNLAIELKNYGPREFLDIEIKEKETIVIDIPLDKSSPTKVTGKITCLETGSPVENIPVYLSYGNATSKSLTNKIGIYTFHDVLPGKYEIFFVGKKNDVTGRVNKVYKKEFFVIDRKTSSINFKVLCDYTYW